MADQDTTSRPTGSTWLFALLSPERLPLIGKLSAHRRYICKDAALAIGRALYARGLAKMPEPSTFSAAELGRYFGENVSRSHSSPSCPKSSAI